MPNSTQRVLLPSYMPTNNTARKSAANVAKRMTRNPIAPERVQAILKGLDEAYPEAVSALD